MFGSVQLSHAENPNLAVIPAPRADYYGFNKYLAIKELAEKSSPNVLFLGDSITEQWATGGKNVWKENFDRMDPFNAGIGSDRTEHVLWRIQNGCIDFKKAPRACVLMIGTNNTGQRKGDETPEQTAEGIKSIIKELSSKYPRMKILLVAILPRGAAKDDKLRLHNDEINQLLAKINVPNVTYLDISSDFLSDDGTLSRDISPDLLHFNEEGYKIYAKAILPALKKMVK